ncbi:FtsK/SpoIIIE domain-containing protein [Rothia nasimurium]|uniref:FtsK/SpoIIIE domain-containing protein n=1 Tax=Rothia nasimurium TaxID=85336 RepID=UPI001F3D3131|nr:FtsK/SpoIIIE domain-containing protein [Rothia nasimurium]
MDLHMRVQQPGSNSFRAVYLSLGGRPSGLLLWEELCRLWGTEAYTWFVGGRDIRDLSPADLLPLDSATLNCQLVNSPLGFAPSAPPLFTLTVLHGPDSQHQFPLARGQWSLGRAAKHIRVADPALEPVAGYLEVSSSGITVVQGDISAPVNLGQPFQLGDSVFVVDRVSETSISSFCDPIVQEVEVPSPRPLWIHLVMLCFPLVIGAVLAWYTGLWFIVLLALGSSVVMGLHMLAQGGETGQRKKLFNSCIDQELAAVSQYRGHRSVAPGQGFVVGRGRRPIRVRSKHKEVGDLPLVDDVPWVVSFDQVKQFWPQLSLSTQRALICQLLRQGVECSVLVNESSYGGPVVEGSPAFGEILEALAGSQMVQLVRPHQILQTSGQVLFTPVALPDLPDQVTQLVVGTPKHDGTLEVPDVWESVTPDGISIARMMQELDEFRQPPGVFHPRGLTRTSELPSFSGPTSADFSTHLWASEVSFYLGQNHESGSELSLGLTSDGPHFLCAGTTGSGKSQLLRTLLWSMVLRYPPERLGLVLIDFKGGAGLGPFAPLPHVASFITDLDDSTLERALKYLRADLNRRKKIFLRAGVSSYEDYLHLCRTQEQPPEFPELVLCIDEFKMLVDGYPEIMEEFMRIATVGRSLGYHLILATQRPQGAISQDIRANISSILCLRVSSSQESFNVLGSDKASHISASTPGRGYLSDGSGQLLEFQAPLLDGLHHVQTKNTVQARFVLSQPSGSPGEQLSHCLTDGELLTLHQSLFKGHRKPQYQPIPPTPTGPLLASRPDNLASSRPYVLGEFEIPELAIRQDVEWGNSNLPILLMASPIDRSAPLQLLVRQAMTRRDPVIIYTESEQTAEEFSSKLGQEPGVQILTPKDFDFVRLILAELNAYSAQRLILIIDGLDTLVDSLGRHPDAEAQLFEALTVRHHVQHRIFCTSLQQPRGKFQHVFPVTLYSAQALETHPVKAHQKDYPRPPHGLWALEGTPVQEVSQGQVKAGSFAWAQFDVDATGTEQLHHLETDPEVMCPWQQLPHTISIEQALLTTGTEPTFPSPGSLFLGVSRNNVPVYLPKVRGGLVPICGNERSGKSTLLDSLIQANPHQSFIKLSALQQPSLEDIEKALDQQGPARPVLLIDDLEYLSSDIQQAILNKKEQFEQIIVTYKHWPRWSTSPVLSAMNGTSTGLALCPETPADLGFFQGTPLPLDLRTGGKVPAGRAVLLTGSKATAFHVAVP